MFDASGSNVVQGNRLVFRCRDNEAAKEYAAILNADKDTVRACDARIAVYDRTMWRKRA